MNQIESQEKMNQSQAVALLKELGRKNPAKLVREWIETATPEQAKKVGKAWEIDKAEFCRAFGGKTIEPQAQPQAQAVETKEEIESQAWAKRTIFLVGLERCTLIAANLAVKKNDLDGIGLDLRADGAKGIGVIEFEFIDDEKATQFGKIREQLVLSSVYQESTSCGFRILFDASDFQGTLPEFAGVSFWIDNERRNGIYGKISLTGWEGEQLHAIPRFVICELEYLARTSENAKGASESVESSESKEIECDETPEAIETSENAKGASEVVESSERIEILRAKDAAAAISAVNRYLIAKDWKTSRDEAGLRDDISRIASRTASIMREKDAELEMAYATIETLQTNMQQEIFLRKSLEQEGRQLVLENLAWQSRRTAPKREEFEMAQNHAMIANATVEMQGKKLEEQTKKIAELEAELAEQKSLWGAATKVVDGKDREIARGKDALETAKREIEKRDREIDDMRNQIANLASEGTQSTLAELHDDKKYLLEKIEDLEEKIKRIDEDRDFLRKHSAEQRERANLFLREKKEAEQNLQVMLQKQQIRLHSVMPAMAMANGGIPAEMACEFRESISLVPATISNGNGNGKTAIARFSEEQTKLIKATVCRPKNREATDDELALFEHQCTRTGLDPLAKQVYAIFRYDSNLGREAMTIQVGIDGFRILSERSGKYAGVVGPFWCGKDGDWKDVWTNDEPPVAAKVGILRKDFQQPVWGVAKFSSYAQKSPFWSKMPEVMLAKCAEAIARRVAFPNDLSGIYAPEEVIEVEHEIPEVVKPKAQQAPPQVEPKQAEQLKTPPPVETWENKLIPDAWLPDQLKGRQISFKEGRTKDDLTFTNGGGKVNTMKQYMAYSWGKSEDAKKKAAYEALREKYPSTPKTDKIEKSDVEEVDWDVIEKEIEEKESANQ